MCKCEHSSLHIGEIPLADVTGTSSGKSQCRTAHHGLDVGGRTACLTVVVTPRLQAPLPHKHPQGVCPLIGEHGLDKSPWDLCAAVSSPSVGLLAPPIWTCFVWGGAMAQPMAFSEFFLFALAQLLCCCCRLTETRLTALLSLRLHVCPQWVWTASPPSVSRLFSLFGA